MASGTPTRGPTPDRCYSLRRQVGNCLSGMTCCRFRTSLSAFLKCHDGQALSNHGASLQCVGALLKIIDVSQAIGDSPCSVWEP